MSLARPAERRLSRRHTLILWRLARAGGAAVALLGAVVLVGWALDLRVLKSVLPGLVAMVPNTALSFVLLGASVWLRAAPHASPRVRVVRLAATVLVGLVGAVTVAEYAAGWAAGIDQLLFRDRVIEPGELSRGRMAGATAVALVLLAAGIGLLDARGLVRRIGEGLLLVAGAIGGIAVVGYLLGVRAFYSSSVSSTVSLPASFAIAALALAALGSQPTAGLARVLVLDSAGGRSARRLLPVAILAPVVIGFIVQLAQAQGLYSEDLELPIASVVSAFAFGTLVWTDATRLDRSETHHRRALADSITDPLTGLANRRALETALAAEQPVAGARPYSIVVADLDGLKLINDRNGHAAGDEALRQVASVLRSVIRPRDVAARVGGDEFVVLLPATDPAGAGRVVERIAGLLDLGGGEGGVGPISVTMGTATWTPGDDPATVLKRADTALYGGKRSGRGVPVALT